MKLKKIISTTNLVTFIIFASVINELTDDYLISIFLTVGLVLVAQNAYNFMVKKRLLTKDIVSIAIGLICVGISFLLLFSILVAITLFVILIAHCSLFAYLVSKMDVNQMK